MKINQVEKTERIVADTLEKIVEIESKGECVFDAPERKKVRVKCHGTSVSGSKILCMEISNNNVIKIIVTYSPDSGEKYDYLIAHLNEKNRWDKALLESYKDAYFPCPFGTGSEIPKTHHWSEYTGTRLDAGVSDVDTDIDKVVAKFASALTAKKDTISKLLDNKEYAENARKVDAFHFNNPDLKRVLFNYLDFAKYKLDVALKKYNVLGDALALSQENNDASNGIKREIDAIQIKYGELGQLKNAIERATFYYAPEEYVVIHPDLNLDNILLNKEKDYEISFIDGFLREGQVLLDHYGPKQIYYFMLKKRDEWLKAENATRETNAKLSLILGKLGEILRTEYKIDEEKKDNIIKNVVDAYFDSFLIKKGAEKKYEKFFEKQDRTKTIQQKTLEPETAQKEEGPYHAQNTLPG